METDRINRNSIIIAKKNDRYIVVNNNDYDNITYHDLCKIIDSDGKHYTRWIPLGIVMKNADWEIINENYLDIVKQQPKTAIDGLLGFAVGDALGVPVEFLDRETVKRINIKEMTGCDSPNRIMSTWGMSIPAGAWSDDTSMLIAGMDSLVQKKGNIDFEDIMKKYLSWWDDDKYTSTNEAFGLGECVEKAFKNYRSGKTALESGGLLFSDNGNGSLMRIFPFSMICIEKGLSEKETIELISNASRITHGHEISRMGCYIYTEFLRKIIETKNPVMAHTYISSIDYLKYFSRETVLAYKKLLNPLFTKIKEEEIKSSGYVVDTLESAIYSIINGTNYESTVLKAINLGNDTDTIGGVTGSIAGMLYGKESIPERWLIKLKRKDYLEELALNFDQTLKSETKNKETIINK